MTLRRLWVATLAGGLVMAVSCPASLLSQGTEAPTLSSARVAAQVGAGMLATPVAFVVGGLAARQIARAVGAGEHATSRAAHVGAYTSVWLATATVPALIGHDGRYGDALAGSALGMVSALAVTKLGNWLFDDDRRSCHVVCWALGVLTVALPSVGATVAYDRSRR